MVTTGAKSFLQVFRGGGKGPDTWATLPACGRPSEKAAREVEQPGIAVAPLDGMYSTAQAPGPHLFVPAHCRLAFSMDSEGTSWTRVFTSMDVYFYKSTFLLQTLCTALTHMLWRYFLFIFSSSNFTGTIAINYMCY